MEHVAIDKVHQPKMFSYLVYIVIHILFHCYQSFVFSDMACLICHVRLHYVVFVKEKEKYERSNIYFVLSAMSLSVTLHFNC